MSANTSAPNRASLLAGLRTGGVRSTSNIPHTAAPGGSFNIPRINLQPSIFPDEDDEPGQFAQNVFAVNHGSARTMPMTAAVDGPNNRFMMQQQRDVHQNPNIGSFSPAFGAQPNHVQAQALQMQMMQLEIIRMQTIQAQQYQAQMLAQSQPQSARRPTFNPPATAGPTGSFDLRSATLNAQMRRSVRQDDDQVPMTAALGGKFGSRPSSGPMGRFSTDDYDDSLSIPPTPNSTTVISGGTSLGGVIPVNANASAAAVSKASETASNWRRGGNNNSVLRGANRPAAIKTSPPPTERRLSPPPALTSAPLGKSRPQPLLFNGAASQPMPAVALDMSEGDNDDGYSTSSSESVGSNSPPTTPRSSSSLEISASPPKDAAKGMPAALGIGRPTSFVAHKASSHRLASQPMRQPRGPPSGPDELGPRNFAARIVSRSTTVA